MRILVTGGAGYIGSHVLKALKKRNHEITVLDNLSTGHAEAVTNGQLIIGDLKDDQLLDNLFFTKKFEAVIHFAGSIVVPESVANPLMYYANNTINSHRLISTCLKHNCHKFIFSSTAAVYGMSETGIVEENTPTFPINPYGYSKLMTEQMLKDVSASSPLNFVALRYFNVSGADPEGEIGQSFPEATHLIKVACETACGKREHMQIFGTDYPTEDGTCVRDYIHVADLADAHVRALEYLEHGGPSEILNCGYGHGYSVKQVLSKVEEVTGKRLKVIETPRRQGDPASLTSVATRIQRILGWEPKYGNLNLIIGSAYEWEKKRPY